MAKKKYVLISLVSREEMVKEPYGRDVLSLFYEHYPNLAPQFANYYEPVNKPTSTVEEGLEYWECDPGLYRRRISVIGSWYISSDRDSIPFLTFEYNWNEKVDWFQLFQQLVTITKSYYGYVHVFTDNEIEPAYIGSPVYSFLRGTASIYLKKGIPNLGWGNYFGEEYIKELDLPLIRKHGFHIEPLGEGYVLNVTEHLSDVITNYESFKERRSLLKSLFQPGIFQEYTIHN